MGDIELLTNALRTRFPSPPSHIDEGWGKLALYVLDCVLSVNRNYENVVLPRLKDFADMRPRVRTLADLQNAISAHASAIDFLAVELKYNDSVRANTLQGVIDYLLDIQHEFPGSTEKDRLHAWAEWARPGDSAFTGVRGFGLARFQRLRRFLGANTAKPSRWVCRFVSESIEREVSGAEALFLLERAAKRANLCIRDIESAIWNEGARRAG